MKLLDAIVARSAAARSVRRAALAVVVAVPLGVTACGSEVAEPPAAPEGPSAAVEEAGAHDHRSAASAGLVPAQATPTSPADLRVSLESLLGHHATLVTRLMRTVLRGDADLVEAASQALVLNTEDLSEVVGGTGAQGASNSFEVLWSGHTDLLFDYTRAVADGDAAGRESARAALDRYRSEFAAFVESATGGALPATEVAEALGPHLDHLTGFADAFAAGDFTRAYDLQRQAFGHMFPLGRALAQAIAGQPGAPGAGADDGAIELRSTLGMLLGEHFELMVDGMRAAVRGSADFEAAAGALRANQAQLTDALDALVGEEQAAHFNEVWAHHIELLVRYAVAVAEEDRATGDAVRSELRSVREDIAASFSALTGGAIPVDAAATALSPHDQLLVEQVEAYSARDYARAHEIAFDGYQHMFDTVAVVAPAIQTYLSGVAPIGGAQTGGGGGQPTRGSG